MILIATEGMDDIVPARRIRLRAKGRSHDGLSPELARQRLTMSGRLFLSFWDLCLDNLPQGRFERRAIAAVDAGAMIRTARGGNLRITTFVAGESEVKIVDPSRVSAVETVG